MGTPTTAPASDEYAPYYQTYIARVPPGDLLAQLERQAQATAALLGPAQSDRAHYRYAPGKWSLIEILGHLSDSERIFAYRALRIARSDSTPLSGFDENLYVPAADFGRRSLADVLGEFQAVRAATVALLRGLPDAAWSRRGVANGQPVTVRALGYIIAGHELHHIEVLRIRYGIGGGAG